MNWTSGKSRLKVKFEKRTQKEFFKQQRLRRLDNGPPKENMLSKFSSLNQPKTNQLTRIENNRPEHEHVTGSLFDAVDIDSIDIASFAQRNRSPAADMATRKQNLLRDKNWVGTFSSDPCPSRDQSSNMHLPAEERTHERIADAASGDEQQSLISAMYRHELDASVPEREPPSNSQSGVLRDHPDDITDTLRIEEITAANSLSPMLCSDHQPSTQSLGWRHFINSPSAGDDVPNVYNHQVDPVKRWERSNARQYPYSNSARDSRFYRTPSSIAISAPFTIKDTVATSSNDISKTGYMFDLDDSRDDDSASYFTQPTNNVFPTHSTVSFSQGLYSTDNTCNIKEQRGKTGSSEHVYEQIHNQASIDDRLCKLEAKDAELEHELEKLKSIVRQLMDDMKNTQGSVDELPNARIIQETSDSPLCQDHGGTAEKPNETDATIETETSPDLQPNILSVVRQTEADQNRV
ncbi:4635_t:CDS:2 [Paraglomus occultum]|uniref:4635_t:CDS:1 n=1 Tax=Paraglomus occultum TaxID=144539 RepID=A0A9N9FNV1_9GLOM|nr:4635_t:CDS:2 [Paraglomus occultum]